jgi:hypothetical protein
MVTRQSVLGSVCCAAVSLFAAQAVASGRAGEERWIAQSTTATAITGDIQLSPRRLRMAGVNLPLRVAAENPRFESHRGPVGARILAVTKPSNPRLLNGNTFGCRKPVRWIAVYQFDKGKQLGLLVFDEQRLPTAENGPGFCASYFYVRP